MDYSHKKIDYFNQARRDLISLIPAKSDNKILELGTGGGDTLITIKEMKLATEVVGIELFKLPNTHQEHPAIDRLIFGDIETLELDLKEGYFDVVLIGDVLEHLVDPWSVVNKLAKYLKPGGHFIVSVPNIRHGYFQIFLKGDFTYADHGLFDRTHLRWFCKKNIIEMMTTKDLAVEKAYPNFEKSPHLAHINRKNKLTFGVFEEFWALQYFVVSRKRS